jgi:DNA repair protein RecO (recombination protein O)
MGTLTEVEPRELPLQLSGTTIFSGFYLNELLMRLMERHDPHPHLFSRYESTLLQLAAANNAEWALRIFERDLLDSLGYGLLLEHTADDISVEHRCSYCYHLEHGPLLADVPSGKGIMVGGVTLLALASGAVPDETALAEAKRLMRAALGLYLGSKPLQSRELFRQGLAAGLHPPATDSNLEE